MRTPLIAGNWKMYKTIEQTTAFIREFLPLIDGLEGVEVTLAPPFTALAAAARELRGSRVSLAAQDLYWEREGAFTGEVSAEMLRDAGCTQVIVGHSERRQLFGETDETVSRKLRAALAAGLGPIVCIGEVLREREEGRTLEVVRRQVEGALGGLKTQDLGGMVLAYEPVWAIGTGLTATPGQAEEAHGSIRELLAAHFGDRPAAESRILYGGSVKPENIGELMAQPDVDGALVGGASLIPASFARIARFRAAH